MKSLTVLALSTTSLLSEIKFDPTFHFNGVMGDTSADAFRNVGGHAHDPNDSFAVQGFEPGLNLRVDDWLAGFTNVNVFDGTSPKLHMGMNVLVKGDKIESITKDAIAAPSGALTIDGKGRTLMPGMIDGHAHVTGGGGEAGASSCACVFMRFYLPQQRGRGRGKRTR